MSSLVPLLEALTASCSESDDWGGYCFFCWGAQTLDHKTPAHDYLDHTEDCVWVEGRSTLAELESAQREPSEEQVERAARALLHYDGDEWSFDGGRSDEQFEPIRKTYRRLARAALRAAL